jgi:hypothetical protein
MARAESRQVLPRQDLGGRRGCLVHDLSLAISSIEMYECFSRHCKLRERARGDGMTLSRCQISQRKRRQPRHESKPPRGCLHLGPIGGLAEWTFTPSIPQSSPPSPISFGHSGGRASWRSKLLSHPSPIDALKGTSARSDAVDRSPSDMPSCGLVEPSTPYANWRSFGSWHKCGVSMCS